VQHVPTGEYGTVVRVKVRAAIYYHSMSVKTKKRIMTYRYFLDAVEVKNDEPEWLPIIEYTQANVQGRKVRDLRKVP